MFKVLEIIKQIENTSGRNDKEAILEANKDNPLLRDVLKFMYCDLITTGLSRKKIEKQLPSTEYVIEDMMEYLKSNNTGSDMDIQIIQRHIADQPVQLRELYTQIATKNLKIGITKSTLNKCYVNEDGTPFIEDFKVMLASKYQDHEEKVKDFLISTKLDGIRCVLQKENGNTILRTRQGKVMEGLLQIEGDAQCLPDNLVLDGELILKNPNNLNSADLFRETMKVVRKDGIKKDVVFHVFDMLPLQEFRKGKSILKGRDRKKNIENLIEDFEYIKAVPTLYDGKDKNQIQYWLDKMENEGKEGIMINLDDVYECTRSRKLLKVKSFKTADVLVLNILEGTNKNTGKLGAITIQFEHDGKLHECNCGSGFDDSERVLYYNNPELLLGKIVEIGYFEISENQLGGVGLRFPTWKSNIRFDKSDISMY